MKLKKRTKIILLIIVLVAIAWIFFNRSTSAVIAPLNTHTVKKDNLVLSYSASGTVESQKEISVFSDTTAQVESVNYRVGDAVNKGDNLLSFKTSSIEDAKLNLEKIQLQVNKNKNEYEIAKALFNVGGASKHEMDSAKLTLDTSLLDLAIAKKTITNFKKNISSPISGVVTEVNADVNFKVDSSKPLFKIADTENLQIGINVPNIKAKKLQVGHEVTVTSDSLNNDEVLKGKITKISKVASKTGDFSETTTRVIVELENYSTLKPGMTTNVTITYNKLENKILVPFNFIQTDVENNTSVVYVLNKDNVVEKRNVTIGENNTFSFEITSGLNENENIIENVNNIYKDGDKIK